jgi:hypothetical protein
MEGRKDGRKEGRKEAAAAAEEELVVAGSTSSSCTSSSSSRRSTFVLASFFFLTLCPKKLSGNLSQCWCSSRNVQKFAPEKVPSMEGSLRGLKVPIMFWI